MVGPPRREQESGRAEETQWAIIVQEVTTDHTGGIKREGMPPVLEEDGAEAEAVASVTEGGRDHTHRFAKNISRLRSCKTISTVEKGKNLRFSRGR